MQSRTKAAVSTDAAYCFHPILQQSVEEVVPGREDLAVRLEVGERVEPKPATRGRRDEGRRLSARTPFRALPETGIPDV
jgi:hypothetical protein